MSNGLLDYIQDFDINKALGVQYGLPKGMLSPELENQMGVGGTLGGITNVIEGMQQGASTPENIFRFLTGQRAGRQNVINTATQNYLNQLNIAKLQGDIAQDPYKLAKLKFEVEKAPYEIEDIKNKTFDSSIRSQAIKLKLKELQDSGDIESLVQFSENPTEYFKAERGASSKFKQYTEGEKNAARLLGLDVRESDSWNEQQVSNYDAIISAPSQEQAAKLNAEALARHKADPNRVPYVYTPSRNEVIAQIRKQNKGVTTVSSDGTEKIVEPTFTRVEKQSLPVGQFEPTKDYPEGGFKGADGKIYSMEQYNKLGIEKQNLLSRDVTREEYVREDKLLTDNMRVDRKTAQYGNYNVNRTSKYIEKILDNPEKFKKLFSTSGGRLPVKINQATGNFFATESDAQDIVNLLNTIKGQQFTNEIQLMRDNNKTGGAVGNVSDREVSMFQDMAANLNYSGSADQLWSELNDLYNQGHKMNNMYLQNFNDFYGQSEFDRYKMNNLKLDKKEYNRSFEESLAGQKQKQFNEKTGNVMPPSLTLSPQGQSAYDKYRPR